MIRWTLALTIPAFLCLASCSDSRKQFDDTKLIGNIIAVALDKFCADNGQYPQALDELVPKYLQDIPSPTWGVKKWKYENRKSYFILQVDESVNTGDGVSHYLRYSGGCGDNSGWSMGD